MQYFKTVKGAVASLLPLSYAIGKGYNTFSLRSHLAECSLNSRRSITVPADQYEVQLNDLQGFTNYSVQVLAVTLKEGPLSDPVYIFTKETGAYFSYVP